MDVVRIGDDEFAALLDATGPTLLDDAAGGVIVVRRERGHAAGRAPLARWSVSRPWLVVALCSGDGARAVPEWLVGACDVLIAERADAADAPPSGAPDAADCAAVTCDGADAVAAAGERVVAAAVASPHAAISLALLLRGATGRSVDDGLVAESACYSLLQRAPRHIEWLATRRVPERHADAAPVLVERVDHPEGARLRVTLDRPHVHNAFSAAMRDALIDALHVAACDPSLRVVIDGAGPSFCAGGDLAEFGTTPDPGTAHLVRLTRSAGRALDAVRTRSEVWLHGACVGAGIEVSAFAGRVVAAPGTRLRLPEVSFGLVPGAGGTVSITRRIGRHRCAWMAVTGEWIDAATAHAWGLVDEIVS